MTLREHLPLWARLGLLVLLVGSVVGPWAYVGAHRLGWLP